MGAAFPKRKQLWKQRLVFSGYQTELFLFGLRSTGKSTWLKYCLGNALFIDLLAPEEYRQY